MEKRRDLRLAGWCVLCDKSVPYFVIAGVQENGAHPPALFYTDEGEYLDLDEVQRVEVAMLSR